MAISSPPSLSKIITEFGSGGSPSNLSSYYRGGIYVANTAANAAIATTAAGLKISQFTGASKYINVTGSVTPTTLSPTSNSVGRTSITTSSVTASGANGTGSYTYSWTIAYYSGISGSGTCSVNSPSAATSSFVVQGPSAVDDANTDVYHAVCTISDGTSSTTVTVVITASNTH